MIFLNIIKLELLLVCLIKNYLIPIVKKDQKIYHKLNSLNKYQNKMIKNRINKYLKHQFKKSIQDHHQQKFKRKKYP